MNEADQTSRRTLKHRVRLMIYLAVSQLSYQQGWQLLNWWYQKGVVKHPFSTLDDGNFDKLVTDLGVSESATAQDRQLFVVGNYISRMWGTQIRQQKKSYIPRHEPPKSNFFKALLGQGKNEDDSRSLLHISGIGHVEEALEQGRGVIMLTCHSTTLPFAARALARSLKIEPFWTLSDVMAGRWYRMKPPNPQIAKLSLNAYTADLTLRALHNLRQGLLIQIAPDLGYLRGTLPFLVGSRLFALKPGFAELAVTTGAALIPYSMSLQPNGHIQVVIQPPPEIPRTSCDKPAAHSEVIEYLLHTYAHWFETNLRTMPGSFVVGVVDKFLNSPRFDSEHSVSE